MALAGPNGSGKTTLLHSSSACCGPRGGRIAAFGRERARGGRFPRSPPPRGAVVPGRRRPALLSDRGRGRGFRSVEPRQAARRSSPHRHRQRSTRWAWPATSIGSPIIFPAARSGSSRWPRFWPCSRMFLLLDEPNGELDDAATERLVGILAGLPQAMIVVSHSREFWQRVTTSRGGIAGRKVVARRRDIGSGELGRYSRADWHRAKMMV